MRYIVSCLLMVVMIASAAELELVPTFENCSVYVNDTKAAPADLAVSYRKSGTEPWLPAHALSVSSNDATPRGSLFGLNPETTYEVRCLDGTGRTVANGTFTTWSDNVPIVRTIDLSELNPAGEPWLIEAGGTADGWVKYVAKPNYVIDGAMLDTEALLIENASYVIVEGLTIRGGQRHGVRLINSHHIRLVNCDISGFGRIPKPENIKNGRGYDEHGKAINWESGVYIDQGHDLVIERCFIHDPRISANSWTYGHPMGPTGIMVRSLGSLVVRHNNIVGSHTHFWNDVIEGYGNGKTDGGFNKDADIYGNFLAYPNDDGIELDGGQCNVRFFGNRIEGGLCGISTAPNLRGPSFIYNNLVANLGDERGLVNGGVKNGGGSSKALGMSHFYHNTFYHIGRGLAGVGFGRDKDRAMFRGISRNNIYAVTGNGIEDRRFAPGNSYDHDLFATPAGGPGLYDIAAEAQANGIFQGAGFRSARAADFRLAEGSPAIGSGVVLPGFNPAGQPVDRGAMATGSGFNFLPHRPLALMADTYQIQLSDVVGQEELVTSQVKLTMTASAGGTIPFTIRKPADTAWFTVEPMAGVVEAGKETVLTVSMDMQAAGDVRRLLGALLISDASGMSLPIAVHGQVLSSDFNILVEAESLPGAEAFAVDATPGSASGSALLLDRETPDLGLELAVDIPVSGDYFIYFRVKCPPPVPNHDSVFLSVDGGEPQRVNLNGGLGWSWAGLTGQVPFLRLEQGPHKLRISARETLYLDAITVRSSSLPIHLDPLPEVSTP